MTDDEYATWDAPYVLGALERTERLQYEQHLADCPHCRAAVADLAGLPGLLGHVDTDIALALVDPIKTESNGYPGSAAPRIIPGENISEPSDSPADLLPRLAERTRTQRRRGRWAAVGGAVVAAAAAVAIAIPITTSVAQHGTPPAATQVVAERQLEPVVATPVSASVRVIDADGKATVEMSCQYAEGGQPYQADFELWMTSKEGTSVKLMGWSAGPGNALTMTRTTDLPPDQITALEVRASGGSTILRSTI
ncbi:anti-sigma factor family protein [Nocardia sp. NPDC051570]|uniref:anti-sigma factor family protein n=1 Tax=Nocardia sp. NPDC051570 TaxID=3364324 RepID=UPI0037B6F146